MTNLQLRAFMKRHKLSIDNIASLGIVSVATVRAWMRPKTSKAHRNMTRQSEALIRGSVTNKPLDGIPDAASSIEKSPSRLEYERG